MGIFNSFNISASGMTAQRLRTDTISQNLANVNTTSTSSGGPYRRQTVVFQEKESSSFHDMLTSSGRVGTGVKVNALVEDTRTDMIEVYDPSHPDADENGYVTYPNVNTVTEMTNLIDATRAYEANVTAFNASKTMAMKGLSLNK